VLLTSPDRNNPSISRERFEALKAHYDGQFTGLVVCAPARMPVETPQGKTNALRSKNHPELFRLLNIPMARRNSGTPVLVVADSE
jgi:hypothetical protein